MNEKFKQYQRRYNREYYQKNKVAFKERWLKRKLKIYEFYCAGSLKCCCCGEKEPLFLTLDHKNNDGNLHRKKVSAGACFYKWVIDKGFPDTFQVLCMNCNFGKRMNQGICPHKTPLSIGDSYGNG